MRELYQGKLSRLALRAVLVSVICSAPYTRISAGDVQDEAPTPQWLIDKHFLNCIPSTLTPTTTLTLQMVRNHPGELGIRREQDDTWYYLVSAVPFTGQELLMTTAEFAKQTTLVIRADLKGYVPDVNGSNQRVFTTSGKYDIYVSDSLESEDGGYKCVVEYKDH